MSTLYLTPLIWESKPLVAIDNLRSVISLWKLNRDLEEFATTEDRTCFTHSQDIYFCCYEEVLNCPALRSLSQSP